MYESIKMLMLWFYFLLKLKNNDDYVISDIENDIVVKVMKLSDVMDNDDFFEINIRFENWVMVFNVEGDDDYNLVEKLDENFEIVMVFGNFESNKELNDDVIFYLYYYILLNVYLFLDFGEIFDILNIGIILVSVKELKFKVYRG